ncbi:hybrid sensor histidine kinase/response regulator transcription factor [Prolixibacter sp. NT017]|uniref:hybrid sensor histidine kinase/response regulator transcription factor n=1 Tax=Prolixibacter sp. NT017 TaxID=2652390 RepID=UPI001E2EA8C1|nr:hybrid sensor histidine kinase/response regulator transcription factor [Prolixibacter sp. NT017]
MIRFSTWSEMNIRRKKGRVFFKGLVSLCWLAYGVFSSLNVVGNDETLDFYHYTNEDGLPSSYVKSIVQDADGFIWLATRISISRFDGKHFQEFPAFDENGKPVKIFSDKLFLSPDSVLIARTLQGLYYYYHEDKEFFSPCPLLNDLGSTQALTPGVCGYWFCQNNQAFFLDQRTGMKEALSEKIPYFHPDKNTGFLNVFVRGKRLVLMSNQGLLYIIDTNKHLVRSLKIPKELGPYQTNLLYVDAELNAWIGESDYGLIRMNLKSGESFFYSQQEKGQHHLPHNLVHCVAQDRMGKVWIGTEAGLAIHNPNKDKLSLYNFNISDPNGLNTDPIYDAFCDRNGNMWLGTYFGGINFWSGENNFFRTWSSGLNRWQLNGNVVSCLTEDSEHNLWIGLEDKGLDKLDVSTGEVTHYSKNNGLSYENLHDLIFLSEHELWIASYTGGINILNTKTNQFRYLNRNNTPGLPSDAVYAFMRVRDSLYIGTSEGIVIYDIRNKKFSRLKPRILGSIQFESLAQTNHKLWFSSSQGVYCYEPSRDSLYKFDKIPEMQYINFVKTDSEGRVWFGDCYQGLCMYNEKDGGVTYFNKDTGFPVSWIFSLEEGRDGWFWASSDNGLVRFSPERNESILYDSNSGIPFNQFNYRASFKDGAGNIYFGGNNGMVSFNEKNDTRANRPLHVVFTGMQLFNKPVRPKEGGVLEESINKVRRLVLDYDQNVFTLEYSAFCYSSGGSCQYAYYLEGFENEWNYVEGRNFATYTNLSPGTYTFHVKGSLDNIKAATNERTLQIIVRPPFWLTNWAFFVYFLLAILFSFLVFKVGKNLEKSRAMVVMERREKEHADEIHKVKLEFFTNISHELKTPLTLILGPLNRIMEEEKLSPAFRKRLIGIERNANRLFQLINQLLEFRKIENGKEALKVAQCDIRHLMDEISSSFDSTVESRDIDFVVLHPEKEVPVWIDAEKVDKIIFNLLSNAFKFTKEGGRIEFSATLRKRGNRMTSPDYDMVLSVSDSGKGIPPGMLDSVFDRFFHVDGEHVEHEGSGIGLAFVKSLVLLHKGEIQVDSELGKGTVFTVRIPIMRSDYSEAEIVTCEPQYIPPHGVQISVNDNQLEKDFPGEEGGNRKPLILLVEDNIELINFMKESLEINYRVITALNGRVAIKRLESTTPDLIISDVMMPEMDGFEFTHRLKTNLATSHIPVILLTSKSGTENRLAGLKTGADYYIEKPFYPAILEQNIGNILSTRKRLIERFKDDAYIQAGEMVHSESDKIFIEKLTSIIKANLGESSLDVSFLVKEMGVSRSLLHMKLKGLVGCSSTEFIRAVRLKEAVKLIASGKCNISEAAYETGFSSPTYFTRRFREFFGKSPREYFNS